jgi:hypothetical protein
MYEQRVSAILFAATTLEAESGLKCDRLGQC